MKSLFFLTNRHEIVPVLLNTLLCVPDGCNKYDKNPHDNECCNQEQSWYAELESFRITSLALPPLNVTIHYSLRFF